MKIVLTCPNCGSSTWAEQYEDGSFECGACEAVIFPEDMSAQVEGGEEDGVSLS